jgi:CIC family chloride channel protein
MRLYPAGGAPWRRLLFPVVGSLGIGYLLFRYFPEARGSGVPQTKAALYAHDGRITLRTLLGKFFCTSATLASGIPLGSIFLLPADAGSMQNRIARND